METSPHHGTIATSQCELQGKKCLNKQTELKIIITECLCCRCTGLYTDTVTQSLKIVCRGSTGITPKTQLINWNNKKFMRSTPGFVELEINLKMTEWENDPKTRDLSKREANLERNAETRHKRKMKVKRFLLFTTDKKS